MGQPTQAQLLAQILSKLEGLEKAIKGDELGNEGLAKRVTRLETKLDDQQKFLEKIKTTMSLSWKFAGLVGGAVGSLVSILGFLWGKN
jgi:predicted branched-subunit amino acid permease